VKKYLNLIAVGRAKDVHVGEGTERLNHLNGLVSRAVFTESAIDEVRADESDYGQQRTQWSRESSP
jgi:hypothetical protein